MHHFQKPDINRLLELQELLLAFSQVERVVHRKQADAYIRESDTEHSYNLALSAWYLSTYFSDLDRDKIIRYALVHDLVEVYAGDTYVYAEQSHLDSKQAREAKALKQLIHEWPDFKGLTTEIITYEQRKDPEARFVYALDKIMPILQIYLTEGHTWKIEKNITPERLDSIKRDKVALSPEIKPYYDELYALLIANRHFFG
ncbi:MAG TPA: HD domain-containing protein [Candidatus Saccharimonadales bacterium]|nr:HD domain-containing protein [Candidatus Saccharimonadales bacterium]